MRKLAFSIVTAAAVLGTVLSVPMYEAREAISSEQPIQAWYVAERGPEHVVFHIIGAPDASGDFVIAEQILPGGQAITIGGMNIQPGFNVLACPAGPVSDEFNCRKGGGYSLEWGDTD